MRFFKSSEERLAENKLYELVATEIERGEMSKGVWAKAISQSETGEAGAKGYTSSSVFKSSLTSLSLKQGLKRTESGRRLKRRERRRKKRKRKQRRLRDKEKLRKPRSRWTKRKNVFSLWQVWLSKSRSY